MIYNLDALGSDRFMQRFVDRFCYLGSSSKQSSTQQQQQAQTSSNTINPLQMDQYQQNYQHAQDAAKSLQPYQGNMVAGFNPTQTQAQGIFSGIGLDNSNQSAINGAIGSVQGVLGNSINPNVTAQSVNPGAIRSPTFNASQIAQQSPVVAGQLANTDLSPYMNPFQKDVIDASVAQNERARQIAQVGDAQHATAAGAFGGSRSGVLSSLTNGEYDRNNQTNLANLNSANFSQAQAGALGDINRTFSADQFNSGQNQAANIYNANNAQQGGMFNATNYLNTQQANQNARINTGEFNATNAMSAQQQSINNALAAQGMTLNAAGEIIPLAQTQLADATTRAGLLSSVGDQQQQQVQNELSAAYQAYMSGQQLTLTQQQLLSQALSMIPIEQTTNSSGNSSGSSTSQTSTNPGLGGILGGIGSLFSGASALGGALGGGSLGMGSSMLGQATGSNAVGYGGIFGAAAPTVSAANIPFPTFNPSSISMPRLA